jgi:hypothetical protein
MKPSAEMIIKIWKWTEKDTEDLFKSFYIPSEVGHAGSGPTNGYAIYLFSMIDLWGSIFRNKFGDSNEASNNVAYFLKKLQEKYPDSYDFSFETIEKIADKLRNNLSHNYGLRVIKSDKVDEWLEIQVNGVGPAIFLNDSKRIQIDCMRLKNHMLTLINEWLRTNNYI